MEISSTILKAWNVKRTRGDVARLTEYTKASKPTIIKAINNGQGSEKMILKISRYYSEKKVSTPKEIESQALNILSNGEG